jgi:hypothetical protein
LFSTLLALFSHKYFFLLHYNRLIKKDFANRLNQDHDETKRLCKFLLLSIDSGIKLNKENTIRLFNEIKLHTFLKENAGVGDVMIKYGMADELSRSRDAWTKLQREAEEAVALVSVDIPVWSKVCAALSQLCPAVEEQMKLEEEVFWIKLKSKMSQEENEQLYDNILHQYKVYHTPVVIEKVKKTGRRLRDRKGMEDEAAEDEKSSSKKKDKALVQSQGMGFEKKKTAEKKASKEVKA